MAKNKQNQQKKHKQNKGPTMAVEVAKTIRKKSNIASDVLGSYTGMSYDGKAPEQDAGDL